MNRRDFLATILAIGGSAAIPFKSIASTSDFAINQAWDALQNEPKVFYLDEWGALSTQEGIEGVHFDPFRQELLGLENPPELPEQLSEYIRTTPGLEKHIEFHFHRLDLDDNEIENIKDWEDWLKADGEEEIRHIVDLWLNDYPEENDYTNANWIGSTGQGDAYYFFREQTEISKLLGVLVPSTPNPASTEFAAFLHKDIDAANELLIANGIPIRIEEGLSYY